MAGSEEIWKGLLVKVVNENKDYPSTVKRLNA